MIVVPAAVLFLKYSGAGIMRSPTGMICLSYSWETW